MEDRNKRKDQLIKELIELRQRITKLERSMTESSLSEVFDALKKISSGDPAVRIEETSEVEFVGKLKHMVNLTAANIGEIVNLSHEFAMVITELFDVMHKVSQGDLNARIFGSSKIELFESLKKVTNEMIEGLSKEILERKKTEEALKLEKAYFEQLCENAPEAIVVGDSEGRIAHANAEFSRLFGYTKEEASERFIDELIVPEAFRNEALSVTHRVAKGERIALEAVRQNKDGKQFNVSILCQPIVIDGKLIGVYGIYRDITERKRAEEALREREEHYRMLFNGALDGIALADVDTGILLECNQALADLVGRNRAEVIGQHQAILHPPLGNNTGFSPTFAQHLTNEEGQVLETQVLCKTGEVKEVEIKANLLYLQGRRMLQGIFRDVTERKRAEEEIKKRIKELEEFYDMAVGRELRMKELKEQMEEMKEEMEKLKKELENYKKTSNP